MVLIVVSGLLAIVGYIGTKIMTMTTQQTEC